MINQRLRLLAVFCVATLLAVILDYLLWHGVESAITEAQRVWFILAVSFCITLAYSMEN